MAEITPPILHGPTSKEKKYDRQLRLWAANGQAALEAAHILLLNSGSGVVGTETLKNLVLPGIGQFTILDPALVIEEDLGVNFFLEDEDVGKFRAERNCALLNELNPDVQGHAITEPFETFITRSNALDPFTLILVTLPAKPELIDFLRNHASRTGIPIFYIHCIGFYAHFTVQLPPAFPIVDTHPDPVPSDLRLLEPWPELSALVQQKTQHLEQMDDEDHGHVPYVMLLLHYLNRWRSEHGGKAPESYKEKTEFRAMVKTGARTNNAEGGEENYDEAEAAVLKTLNAHTPGSGVKEVFMAPESKSLDRHSPDFWIIASAVHEFYLRTSALPLSGSVPDMKAKSADYVQLQQAYKSKARADVAATTQIVRKLESDLGRSPAIDDREIEAFCKSASTIKLVRGRTPHVARPGHLPTWADRASSAANALSDPDSLMLLYIAFLAYDSYAASHSLEGTVGSARGETPDSLAAEAAKITGIAQTIMDALIKEADSFMEDPDYSESRDGLGQIVEELVRAGGSELHNVAAAAGGMVAQEAIKVITKQYVPIDNTCLFDAIRSKTSVVRV